MTAVSENFHVALDWASRLHEDQVRKGGTIPYVAHLMGAATIVFKAGGTEDQAIAALLHDALEDQAHKTSIEAIKQQFGETVARIVMACTDETPEQREALPWRKRKLRYLKRLATLDAEAMLVLVADKLDNVRDIVKDLEIEGDGLWERFTGKKDGMLWYHQRLCKALTAWTQTDEGRRQDALNRLVSEFVAECEKFLPYELNIGDPT